MPVNQPTSPNTTFAQWLNDKIIYELGTSGIRIAETLQLCVAGQWWRLIDSPQIEHIQTFVNRERESTEPEEPPEPPVDENSPDYFDPPEYVPWEEEQIVEEEEVVAKYPPITNTGGISYIYEDEVYYPYPFRREGVKREVSNINKQTRLLLPDTVDGMIKRMLREGTEFRKSRVILSQVFMNHKNSPSNSIILIDGYIQDWSFDEGSNLLTFTVTRTLLGQSAPWPRRHMLATCTHVFKGERCRLVGNNLPICKKTEAECRAYGNLPRRGAFPWVAARQRRILWR
jgi:hypothetical protein